MVKMSAFATTTGKEMTVECIHILDFVIQLAMKNALDLMQQTAPSAFLTLTTTQTVSVFVNLIGQETTAP